MINFETASREELLAYIEQQKTTNKKVNKTTKLSEDLLILFNSYSNNSDDKLLQLHYLLCAVFNDLAIPINEELDKLDYVPEEEDKRKVAIVEIKKAAKELVLRKPNKKVVSVVEVKEVNTPL